MTDKLKRYVLPNLPYLLIFWFFLKLGTAYRIAEGADFGQKLIGLFQSIGPAFGTIAPGLHGFDWLIGLIGAAAVRLFVYCKTKNAKKFRRDAEYGSARWGTAKDIKPFIDPVFQNNIILTGTEFLTMNTRPKNPANARNLNCCVIGSSGSGKTRFWLTPQLLQAHSSYVVVDPKGGILGQVGAFLTRQGYKIKVFNSIDFSRSMHYNPLAYVRTENDILKFVNALITNTKGDGKEGDEFWTKAETLLYCALIGYIVFEAPEEERNLNTLVDMLGSMEVREDDENYKNAIDYMFEGLSKRKPDHFAVRQYAKYKLASGKTAKSILISCGARLAPFDIPQLREIMSYDEMELDRMGDRKTAAFFVISDTDSAYNFIVALAFSQMFNLLCAVGRGGQHGAGAPARKAGRRDPFTGNLPMPVFAGTKPAQSPIQRPRGNHYGKHGQRDFSRRPGTLHHQGNFRGAGAGNHFDVYRQPDTGPVGELRPEFAAARQGTDDDGRNHHYARRPLYPATAGTAPVLFAQVRFEKAPQLQADRRGGQKAQRL